MTGQDSMEYVPGLSYFTSLRNAWPKPTGFLQDFREGETILGSISFLPHP
jgi:hypothetical protein